MSTTRLAEDFKHIVKAANAGMRLHKLTLIGFTPKDDALAIDVQDLCLAGIRELVLEPWAVLLGVSQYSRDPHAVNRLLHIFPGLERLEIRGQYFASLSLPLPCLHLEELSLSFCPANISVNCANLRSLRLAHRFSTGPAHRAAEMQKLDMNFWACG